MPFTCTGWVILSPLTRGSSFFNLHQNIGLLGYRIGPRKLGIVEMWSNHWKPRQTSLENSRWLLYNSRVLEQLIVAESGRTCPLPFFLLLFLLLCVIISFSIVAFASFGLLWTISYLVWRWKDNVGLCPHHVLSPSSHPTPKLGFEII